MRILFLGGTAFVGRHTLEAALERGHDVTFVHGGAEEELSCTPSRASPTGRLTWRCWPIASSTR